VYEYVNLRKSQEIHEGTADVVQAQDTNLVICRQRRTSGTLLGRGYMRQDKGPVGHPSFGR